MKKFYPKLNHGFYNSLSIVISTTMALFSISLLFVVFFYTRKISKNIRKNIEMQCFLNKKLSKQKINSLLNYFEDQDYILADENKKKIKFISQQTIEKLFVSQTHENFWEVLEISPFRDVIIIKIDYKYQRQDALNAIKKKLENHQDIYEVIYPKNLTSYVNKNFNRIFIVMSVFSLILLFSVFMLINSTIKISIYSQRLLIRSMQLVGAYDSYIKKPFLIRSAFVGILSGLLSSILTLILFIFLNYKSREIVNIQNPVEIFIILFSTSLLGILIDIYCTDKSVNKYLNSDFSQMY